MKKKIVSYLAIVFTILLAVSSCKKDADKKADQDLAASVTGQYEVNYIYLNGSEGSLPTDSASAKVDVIKKDQSNVSLNLIVTKLGSAPDTRPLIDAALKEENSTVNLYSGTDKVGTINGNDLEIHVIENNNELVVRAKK